MDDPPVLPTILFPMTLTILALLSAPLFAQQPSQDPLLRWMDQIAQEQLQRRENALTAIHNVADADRRKAFVRQTILSLLGGLPDYNGPLNPRITGRIQSEPYAIEKVIFDRADDLSAFAGIRLERRGRAGDLDFG